MEVPEPCRKARQARPLSLPQASRPSGLFKHIDPVSVALSAHPLRARPLSRDFEARCAQPGACVGGSGPGSKCRRGERATDLQYPATLAARFRVSHFVACCHAAQASPWGGGAGVWSGALAITARGSSPPNTKQPLFFLGARRRRGEQPTPTRSRCHLTMGI